MTTVSFFVSALETGTLCAKFVLVFFCQETSAMELKLNIVQSAASRTTRSGLRSTESNDYITPRLKTKFGERSFSHAGPAPWNCLPADLRAISDCSCFKSKHKT